MIDLKEFFTNYFNGDTASGVIRLIVDILLVIGLVILFLLAVRKKINILKLVIVFVIGVVLFLIAAIFKLNISVNVIKFSCLGIVLVTIILYSQEIRHFFEKKEANKFNYTEEEKKDTISILCDTVSELSRSKTGALITIERNKPIEAADNATIIDAAISKELLLTIFYHGTPLHDGGVVIRNNRVYSATAYYPLSNNHNIPQQLGTRHRAAVGLSEISDAYTIIVSEETGGIRYATEGNVSETISVNKLREILNDIIGKQ